MFGGKISSGCINPKPPNPDPLRFTVLRNEIVNGRSILLVYYPDCTTYEGRKLLLLKSKYKKSKRLDPHFTNDSENSILARFEPNDTGWYLAKICAAVVP